MPMLAPFLTVQLYTPTRHLRGPPDPPGSVNLGEIYERRGGTFYAFAGEPPLELVG